MALGSRPDDITKTLKLDTDEKGYIKINDENMTSREKVFAGGDLAKCKGTVAWAARSGRDAAESIKKHLEQ